MSLLQNDIDNYILLQFPYLVYTLFSNLNLLVLEYIDFLYRTVLGSAAIASKTQCLTSFVVIDVSLGHGLFDFDWVSTSSENDIQIFKRSSSSFSYILVISKKRGKYVGRSR